MKSVVHQEDLHNPPVMLTLQAPIDTTFDEALEKGYDIIKSKDGRREPPLELEVCSETMSPPNHRDYETSSLVKQNEIIWEKR